MMHRILIGWLMASTGLVACGPSAEDCQAACERPYVLQEEAAKTLGEAWKRLPEKSRAGAVAVYEDWQARAAAARSEYADSCVSQCMQSTHSRTSAMVKCRREATTVGEWKRCAP